MSDDEEEEEGEGAEELDEEGEDEEESAVPEIIKKEPTLTLRLTATKPQRKKFVLEPRTPSNAPEVSVVVMFRAKFGAAFEGVPDFGPQDVEDGLVSEQLTPELDAFLCRILTLVLSRKKNVESGHYNRALEEAVSINGAIYWGLARHNGPFKSNKSFVSLDWEGRLEVLVALVHWALASSDQIRKLLAKGYSAGRLEDDRNCPLAVMPLGMDGERRRYYIIEGLNDAKFRLFRETNPRKQLVNWTPIASSAAEVEQCAEKLANEDTDKSRNAKTLAAKLRAEATRLEGCELRRNKRAYRKSFELEALSSGDGGLYLGRTRGRRVNYNASEDEFLADGEGRRSTRQGSPETDSSTVYTTASGRAIRRPVSSFASSLESDKAEKPTAAVDEELKPRRAAQQKPQYSGYASDDLEEEEAVDDDEYINEPKQESDEEFDDEIKIDRYRQSLPVVLKYRKSVAV
ncbi:hypothetical protein V1512DRAFT_205996 [Lipomyces arxii]|uniref:uncharacterized protein n=1 Tax=Lipomyces arxii TaxID=56418 RepID=UPI0034CF67F2